MSRRVLLTGASGFIGSNVLRYLLDHTDWTFTCLASWKHKGNPIRITNALESTHYDDDFRVDVVTHDLRGPVPQLGTFDYILHLASESHVDRSIADPVPFIENNVAATLNMLEYARRHRPLAFVQFSTDEVYGADAVGSSVEEWGTVLPSNPYAASKAAQEAIAIAYWRTYRVPVVITNTNNVIGPGQDAEKFVPKAIAQVLASEPVTIHSHKGEIGSRFYNPVDNVSDALRFVLERAIEFRGDRPPRYNLSGGRELTNLEMAQAIADGLGRELRYRITDVEDLRPGYDTHYASTDGLLAKLGWEPPVTFDQGLADLLELYR
jgi:dTDP-glucose 4,6-dehydratase